MIDPYIVVIVLYIIAVVIFGVATFYVSKEQSNYMSDIDKLERRAYIKDKENNKWL